MLGRYAPPASVLRLASREMVEADRFICRAIDRHPNPWERITAIRSHVFYSVLALTVAHLMRRQAQRAGLHMSVRELLTELAGIGETVLLYHDGGKGRPRARRMLTDTTPTQQRLADLFDIHRYAPTR